MLVDEMKGIKEDWVDWEHGITMKSTENVRMGDDEHTKRHYLYFND